MDRVKVAQELVRLAKSLVALKRIEVIVIDEGSLQSLKNAERKKTRLENAGYTLIKESASPFRSVMVYELKKGV